VQNALKSECEAMVDITLNDLISKVKVIHLGRPTNRFLSHNTACDFYSLSIVKLL